MILLLLLIEVNFNFTIHRIMKNNLYDKSYAFAIRVVKGYQFLSKEKREFVLSKQFLKSGTSIGANVAEANGAISKADFSSKIPLHIKSH